jgi:hypothetical protein
MNLISISTHGNFDSLSASIKTALIEAGFVVSGTIALKRENDAHASASGLKYEVIVVDLPRVTSQMVEISPGEGNVLPACVSLIEIYPGGVNMIIANPTEALANNNTPLFYLAHEVTSSLQNVLEPFARNTNAAPDLVTSWE